MNDFLVTFKNKKSTMLTSLPIFNKSEEIITALENNDVLILEAKTGSGKSTVLPILIYSNMYRLFGRGTRKLNKIASVQPRRIAVMNVKDRLRENMENVFPGGADYVGYTIGGESDYDPKRQAIRVMTDGILKNEIIKDKELSQYSVIIMDEAHERSLDADVINGFLSLMAGKRSPPLKIVITSADVKREPFTKLFSGARVGFVSVEGAPFEIDTYRFFEVPGNTFIDGEQVGSHHRIECYGKYRENEKLLGGLILEILFQSTSPFPNGYVNDMRRLLASENFARDKDVLIFLPGVGEIQNIYDRISKYIISNNINLGQTVPLVLYKLFSNAPREEQDKILKKDPNLRELRIIFATNVAETSITVPGITLVIDSGYSKDVSYDPRINSTVIYNSRISQAEANQRRGRTGRVEKGTYISLYDQKCFDEMEAESTPDILQRDLSMTQLLLFRLGESLETFPFIDDPSASQIILANYNVSRLRMIGGDKKLTSLGEFVSSIPISDPKSAVNLWTSLVITYNRNKNLTEIEMLKRASPYLKIMTIMSVLTEVRTENIIRYNQNTMDQFMSSLEKEGSNVKPFLLRRLFFEKYHNDHLDLLTSTLQNTTLQNFDDQKSFLKENLNDYDIGIFIIFSTFDKYFSQLRANDAPFGTEDEFDIEQDEKILMNDTNGIFSKAYEQMKEELMKLPSFLDNNSYSEIPYEEDILSLYLRYIEIRNAVINTFSEKIMGNTPDNKGAINWFSWILYGYGKISSGITSINVKRYYSRSLIENMKIILAAGYQISLAKFNSPSGRFKILGTNYSMRVGDNSVMSILNRDFMRLPYISDLYLGIQDSMMSFDANPRSKEVRRDVVLNRGFMLRGRDIQRGEELLREVFEKSSWD